MHCYSNAAGFYKTAGRSIYRQQVASRFEKRCSKIATKRGIAVRTYVWLKDHDYVVVLERQQKNKGDVFMLITSFYLDFEAKRRDLQSRYERRRK
jgi:hypothetical protein